MCGGRGGKEEHDDGDDDDEVEVAAAAVVVGTDLILIFCVNKVYWCSTKQNPQLTFS